MLPIRPQHTARISAHHPHPRQRRLVLTHATPEQQEDSQNIVEGYDITKPDIWESNVVGTALQVGLVAFSVGLVVTLVYLATPLITYVVDIYPSPEALTQVQVL